MKKPVKRVIRLEEALSDLIVARMCSSSIMQQVTQSREHVAIVLLLFRGKCLEDISSLYEVSQDTSQEQMAS